MIRGKTVRSIDELIIAVKKDYMSWRTTTFPWFRGELGNTQEPLLPKLYRKSKNNITHDENQLLQHFRMKAPSLGMLDTPPREHTDEWLFLAQHVGLPTRLLDWTEGLFVALYFALKEKRPIVWMLDPCELNRMALKTMRKDNEFPLTWYSPDRAQPTNHDLAKISYFIKTTDKKPNEIMEGLGLNINLGNYNIRAAWENDEGGTDLPVAIHPTNIHTRMNTQKSVFTIQGKDRRSLSILVDDRILKKYIIDPKCKGELTRDLRMIGITHISINPDLDNLAKELSEVF